MAKNTLTKEQKFDWKKNGYILLRNVLSVKEIENLTIVIDQMYEEYLQQSDVSPNAEFDRRNVMEENDLFILYLCPLAHWCFIFSISRLRADFRWVVPTGGSMARRCQSVSTVLSIG